MAIPKFQVVGLGHTCKLREYKEYEIPCLGLLFCTTIISIVELTLVAKTSVVILCHLWRSMEGREHPQNPLSSIKRHEKEKLSRFQLLLHLLHIKMYRHRIDAMSDGFDHFMYNYKDSTIISTIINSKANDNNIEYSNKSNSDNILIVQGIFICDVDLLVNLRSWVSSRAWI
ncbi:hypothetical protein BDC45DRAFT_559177 [Circinella umbellata]|nr:hypothetical protein BDC45DRAFT_559177 [Circinella umbellata]